MAVTHQTDKQADGQTNRTGQLTDGERDRQVGIGTDRQADGGTDGWKNERTYIQRYRLTKETTDRQEIYTQKNRQTGKNRQKYEQGGRTTTGWAGRQQEAGLY